MWSFLFLCISILPSVGLYKRQSSILRLEMFVNLEKSMKSVLEALFTNKKEIDFNQFFGQ